MPAAAMAAMAVLAAMQPADQLHLQLQAEKTQALQLRLQLAQAEDLEVILG
jgi:hypothetical protein